MKLTPTAFMCSKVFWRHSPAKEGVHAHTSMYCRLAQPRPRYHTWKDSLATVSSAAWTT
jgi:hypothetical protein